jgi:hypothetical protein
MLSRIYRWIVAQGSTFCDFANFKSEPKLIAALFGYRETAVISIIFSTKFCHNAKNYSGPIPEQLCPKCPKNIGGLGT